MSYCDFCDSEAKYLWYSSVGEPYAMCMYHTGSMVIQHGATELADNVYISRDKQGLRDENGVLKDEA